MPADLRIDVDLSGLTDLTRRYPATARKARLRRLTEAVLLLERDVKLNTPVGAGPIHLRDTIFSRVQDGDPVTVGIVGTPLQHGLPVEMGTKPHFPPVAPIRHWVERKLGLSGREADSAAFAIARAISKRGTKGAGMFAKAIEDNEAAIIRLLESIPADIIREVNA